MGTVLFPGVRPIAIGTVARTGFNRGFRRPQLLPRRNAGFIDPVAVCSGVLREEPPPGRKRLHPPPNTRTRGEVRGELQRPTWCRSRPPRGTEEQQRERLPSLRMRLPLDESGNRNFGALAAGVGLYPQRLYPPASVLPHRHFVSSTRCSCRKRGSAFHC